MHPLYLRGVHIYIPYLTILVAGGIGGYISIITLSLLEKIGF